MITRHDITFRRFQPVSGINYRKQLRDDLEDCRARNKGVKEWQKKEQAEGRLGYLNPQTKSLALDAAGDLAGKLAHDIFRARALGVSIDTLDDERREVLAAVICIATA